jgi:hypothetical protein
MMAIRVVAFLLALAAPVLAEAHCREMSSIVGYQRCTRFGTWGFGVRLSLEVGATALRLDGDAIDATANGTGTGTKYHFMAAPGDDRPLTAAGVRMRFSIGFGRTFYATPQLDLAPITGGPRLIADVSTHGGTSMTTASSDGFVSQYVMLAGLHRRFGAVSLAVELGPGLRIASYAPGELPRGTPTALQGWFVLQAQPAMDVWLTPNVSLGVQAGANLVDQSSVSAALVLGLHGTPYDMAR